MIWHSWRLGISVSLGWLGLVGCRWLPDAAPAPQFSLPSPLPVQTSQPTTLPALARQAIQTYLISGTALPLKGIPHSWQRQQGVFVTLSVQGQMRGCWGSLTPTAPSIAHATVQAAIGAATRDPRYPPLRLSELDQVRIQVALIRAVTPITDLQAVDPTRYGLWIRSGAQGAVLLPGEALTQDWQLSRAKALAGIPQSASVEIFRIEADFVHEF